MQMLQRLADVISRNVKQLSGTSIAIPFSLEAGMNGLQLRLQVDEFLLHNAHVLVYSVHLIKDPCYRQKENKDHEYYRWREVVH